jgi:DNA-binding LacI/PurR family transcriptional regulator
MHTRRPNREKTAHQAGVSPATVSRVFNRTTPVSDDTRERVLATAGALGYAAIRVHHLRIPDDISVVGFDDISMAVHTNPPLTTIAQPKQRTGQLAMQMLNQMLRGEPVPGGSYTLVDSPLIVRESNAPTNYSGRTGTHNVPH